MDKSDREWVQLSIESVQVRIDNVVGRIDRIGSRLRELEENVENGRESEDGEICCPGCGCRFF